MKQTEVKKPSERDELHRMIREVKARAIAQQKYIKDRNLYLIH